MADSKVINDADDFVPMPTPDRVLPDEAARRLDAIPFEFADIRALARRILARAVEQSQQKLAAARAQVAAMEKQAYDKAYKEAFAKAQEEGLAKGEKNGLAAAEGKLAAAVKAETESLRQNAQPAAETLAQLAAVMNDNRQRLLAQAEGDLLLLSLDIAKRLVGRELSLDPEAIRPLAVECIGLVAERSDIAVKVNPEDLRVMREILPELKDIFPDLGSLRIEADQAVERGGIMASTREAEVDMRLATRLAAFEEAILGFSGEAAKPPWNAAPAAEDAAAIPPPPPEPDTPTPEVPPPEPGASRPEAVAAALPPEAGPPEATLP
ncbi:MAG: hypothetical protein LBV15_01765 [Planctomycetota bacterium]|jgi:flagellar biosynthesis/type III secretory pathway protein FliH|nr:hypothetical protein [Planctomycetota bacterium]